VKGEDIMNIDMEPTINQLRVLEHQFNYPQKSKEGVENSYLCLCGVEEIAKDLLRFVENNKSMFHKLMVDKFMKRDEKYNGTEKP
jgi:hypothetical protein